MNLRRGLAGPDADPLLTNPSAVEAFDPSSLDSQSLNAPGTPNYGRPRRAQKLPPPNPKPNPTVKGGRPPLPALEPYRTSYERRRRNRRATAQDPSLSQPPSVNVAVVPSPPPALRRAVDPDPFQPVGYSFGGLRVSPYLDVEGGGDSNPNRVNRPLRGSGFVHGEAGGSLQSNWSAHSLKGQLRVGYFEFPGVSSANRPEGAGNVDGVIDVTRNLQIETGGAFSITTLRQGSPEVQPIVNGVYPQNRPVALNVNGYVGPDYHVNRLDVGLRGIISREELGNAYFVNGPPQRLSMNDNTTLGLRPHISYEVLPGFKPYVEATIDRRLYDEERDLYGYRRTSTGYAARGGTTYDYDNLVKAEVSAGYVERNYEDERLATLRGPTFEGLLTWTPTPISTLTLRGGETYGETTVANASASVLRSLSAQYTHLLTRRITLTGVVSYGVNSYEGRNLAPVNPLSPGTGVNERTLNVLARAEYAVTRELWLRASYRYERLRSTAVGNSFHANAFMFGLRLQR